MSPIRTVIAWLRRVPVIVLLGAGGLLGILAGLMLFTFGYAGGLNYFGNDPAACNQCHAMNEQYNSWQQGPHHHTAGCNDCHAPHDNVVHKYVTKADNGFWHGLKFTTGGAAAKRRGCSSSGSPPSCSPISATSSSADCTAMREQTAGPRTTGRVAGTGTVEERPVGSALRSALIVLLVTAVALGGFWWLNRPAAGGSGVTVAAGPGGEAAPRIGQPAPDFTATTTDGRTIRLSELRGRPVWLMFGASWCAPCRVEAPDIQQAYAAGVGNVQVVAVYMGEDSRAAQQFADSLGLTYTHVADPDRELAAAWGVNGIPVHWFIDSDGVVQGHQVGILGPERIRAQVEPLDHGGTGNVRRFRTPPAPRPDRDIRDIR